MNSSSKIPFDSSCTWKLTRFQSIWSPRSFGRVQACSSYAWMEGETQFLFHSYPIADLYHVDTPRDRGFAPLRRLTGKGYCMDDLYRYSIDHSSKTWLYIPKKHALRYWSLMQSAENAPHINCLTLVGSRAFGKHNTGKENRALACHKVSH